MEHYLVSERDLQFVLFEQLKVQELVNYEKFNGFSKEDFDMILSEALKVAREVVAPANVPGDRKGCRFDNGNVYLPEEYHKVYELFKELGWCNLSVNPEYGGQGLPTAISNAVEELFTGACPAFSGYFGLTVGAARLIESFGTPELKEKYCKKMYDWEWGGTMCLTEPQAGSDVGNVKTVARRSGDHYLISGNKIFISNAEHDLTENIIYPALARLEGAPDGTRGLSLFLIPKFMVNDDGTLGERNDVVCTNIEHKMGLHGSATCTLSFGENGKCVGYLLGKENEGIKAMFQMMNEARLLVGLQGLAVSSTAYQNALKYAKERIQGTEVGKSVEAGDPRVAIINHPDIRRMLLTMKAYVEGARALVYLCGYLIDMSEVQSNPEEKEKFENLLEILTPICKAYCTDMGLKVVDLALRVHGGYGYICEYPIEQYIRDLYVSIIYEGTNSIQALDLLGRKVAMKKGAAFKAIMELLGSFMAKNKNHEQLGEYIGLLEKAQKVLLETTMFLGGLSSKGELKQAVLNATPYLEMFGDVVNAYLLLEQAVIAHDKIKEVGKDHPDYNFYSGKIYTACFFIKNILPKVNATAEAIKNADSSALEVIEEAL